MNKELEALNELERFVNEDIGIKGHNESGWHLADKPEFHLIKSALERKEKLEKVWEIVKEKEVNTADFRESLLSFGMTYKHYVNNYKNYSWELLTETEFNLLKEMLEEK